MQKTLFIVILMIILLNSGCSNFSNFKACTQEGKICPDGSVVGRTGPNCEFSPCPITPCTDAKAFCESKLETIDGILDFNQTILENTFYQDKSCKDWVFQCKWYPMN